MLKLLGAGCLVLAAGLLGERRARQEQRKLEVMESLRVSLAVLEAEVEFLSSGLSEALAKAGAAAPLTADLFRDASRRIAAGEVASQAWQVACSRWSARPGATSRCSQIVGGLAAAFGPWRAEDIIRHIRLADTLLKEEQALRRPGLETTCRMWRYLGVAAGLVIALLLC